MSLKKKSIFILSTGGTISMHKTAHGYAPEPGFLEKSMAKLPELKNHDMPHYTVHEYEKPIDSSNMTLDDWCQMGKYIEKYYNEYDGFVILHGTDTMAYSASALSFMLENLNKPVILTGSQLPLFETRNDARENLINAMLIAGHYAIPEVCIYFNNKLFRGNRCKKIDAISFAAFASPNFPALARVGTDIRIHREFIRSASKKSLTLQLLKPVNIMTLRIFPGVSIEMLDYFAKTPLQALVLESYGVGTAPSDERFIGMLKAMTDKGIVIVNCSQCAHAKVKMQEYAAGAALLKAGVISGGDMTVEAAITKLFYLYSKVLSPEQIKVEMMQNLRGEKA